MSDGYKGQPNYVVAGFLCDVYEDWTKVAPNDEWGEYLQLMWEFAQKCLGVKDGRALKVIGWVRAELERAVESDWWGDEEEYEEAIHKARAEYDHIVADWRAQAPHFKAEAALEQAIAELPEWVKPDNPRAKLEFELAGLTRKQADLEQEGSRVGANIIAVKAQIAELDNAEETEEAGDKTAD